MEFKLEKFQGPLDLLLHLVSEHRMELWEIRILELIDQYLAIMGSLSEEELEGASEFLEMAARLVYLKSAALLPKREEEGDPEGELVGQLVEYGLCKKMAAKLEDMARGVFLAAREPMQIDLPTEYNLTHQPSLLVEAYVNSTGKKPHRSNPEEAFEEIVATPVVSVPSRIIFILRGLKKGTARRLRDLFEGARSHGEAIATFLGLLELMKVRRVLVDDQGELTLMGREAGKDRAAANGE